jgi:hypothetical protein
MIEPQALLYQVMVRPDITEERRGLVCIWNAIRRVCRETLLLRQQVKFTPEAGHVGSSWLGVSTIQIPDLDAEAPFQGTGKLRPIRVLSARLSDVSGGDQVGLREVSWPAMQEMTREAPAAAGDPPACWADSMGVLRIFPAFTVAAEGRNTLLLDLAVQPADGDALTTLEGIPLPAEAEDAIVAGALAEFYGLPGRGQNLSMSQFQARAFHAHLGNLRSLNRVGTSGANHQYASPFHFNLRG